MNKKVNNNEAFIYKRVTLLKACFR